MILCFYRTGKKDKKGEKGRKRDVYDFMLLSREKSEKRGREKK